MFIRSFICMPNLLICSYVDVIAFHSQSALFKIFELLLKVVGWDRLWGFGSPTMSLYWVWRVSVSLIFTTKDFKFDAHHWFKWKLAVIGLSFINVLFHDSFGTAVRTKWGLTLFIFRFLPLLFPWFSRSILWLTIIQCTVKQTWSQPIVKGSPPTPRDSHSCTTVGDNLFVFGGTDGRNPLKDLHILDTCEFFSSFFF